MDFKLIARLTADGAEMATKQFDVNLLHPDGVAALGVNDAEIASAEAAIAKRRASIDGELALRLGGVLAQAREARAALTADAKRRRDALETEIDRQRGELEMQIATALDAEDAGANNERAALAVAEAGARQARADHDATRQAAAAGWIRNALNWIDALLKPYADAETIAAQRAALEARAKEIAEQTAATS